MRKTLLSLLLCSVIASLQAQQLNPKDNTKYWYYRYRLKTQFLREGLDDVSCNSVSGFSIPAERTFYERKSIDPRDRIKWAEGSLYLGYYIGVLATEYKLLRNKGQSVTATLEELYYAMKAYERLDRKVEVLYYPKASTCAVNGFFSRDDVGPNWVNANFGNSKTPLFDSDWNDKQVNNHQTNPGSAAYPSADQIAGLFMGFALVVKSLDNSVAYNGYNFVAKAKEYTILIANYTKTNNWSLPIPNTNPKEYPNYSGPGDEVSLYSYGIAKAAEAITNNPGQFGTTILPGTPMGNSFPIWQSMNSPLGMSVIPKDFTRHLLQVYASVGNSWECGFIANNNPVKIGIPYPCFRNGKFRICRKDIRFDMWCYNASSCAGVTSFGVPFPVGCAPFRLPDLTINTTGAALRAQSVAVDTEIMPLLHKYLQGIKTSANITGNHFTLANRQVNGIITAPCDGPHYKPTDNPTDVGVAGWRADFKWIKTRNALNGDNNVDAVTGNLNGSGKFNGLDYMLLYNLFLLQEDYFAYDVPAFARNYSNEMNYEITNNRVNNVETLNLNTTYKAFKTISIGNTTLASGANLTLRAGERIDIKPGFVVQPGATITSLITSPSPVCEPATNTYYQKAPDVETSAKTSANPDPAAIQQAYEAEVKQLMQDKLTEKSAELAEAKVKADEYKYVPVKTYLAAAKLAEKTHHFAIYPNPVNQNVTLEFTTKGAALVSFSVTDIYGRQVQNLITAMKFETGKHVLDFSLAKIPAGVYSLL